MTQHYDLTAANTPALTITGPQHDIPESVDQLLATILAWPRPHLSFAEFRFRTWLAAQITERTKQPVEFLDQGVMYTTIAMPDGRPSTTLFSCHIDTADAAAEGAPAVGADGANICKQKSLMYDANFGTIFLDKASPVGTCLGADDGIGVWMLLKMIEAKVPGGYIFHTGEEVCGVGSRGVLAKNMNILKKYEVAVAFDRPRCNEVITHQGCVECASDKMASTLCERLNKHGFDYKPSNRGGFTDTKVYRGVIAECLNIGVGYEQQHGLSETQDYGHACALLEAVCHIDWTALPVDRDPAKPDPAPTYYHGRNAGSYGGFHGQSSLLDDEEEEDWRTWFGKKTHTQKTTVTPLHKGKKKGKKSEPPPEYTPSVSVLDEVMQLDKTDIELWCDESPETVADTMVELAVEVAQLRAEVAVLRAMTKGAV